MRRENRAVPEGRLNPLGYGSIMSHTYCSVLFHCVFSTKDRRKSITPEVQPRLWAYLGGIAREHGMKALAVGGTEDHVHILMSLPASIPLAKAMREIKSGSSRWMHETCGTTSFAWQEGYGAFSIGQSAGERDDSVYPAPGRASSKTGFPIRVHCISEETWDRLRSAICVGIGFGRPSGACAMRGLSFPGLRPPWRTPPWATLVCSLREHVASRGSFTKTSGFSFPAARGVT
jgi:putative transposase